MKKEAGKQGKKWLLPVLIAAAVLVIAGTVLGFVLGTQQPQSDGGAIQSKIYWNVDREQFIEEETGLSAREPAEDGIYYVRFAVGGEQKELPIADKQLVNVIDGMTVMGLVFDNDGTVIDAVPVEDFATESVAGLFVQEVRDDVIIVNSSIAMNGMEIEIPLNENTGIYDVSADAEMVGQSTTCDLMDTVYAYADAEGNTTDVLIIEHALESKVYWRVERKYDSEKGETSRIPDEQGVYSMDFAVDSEVVTLKCKDKALVTAIDSRGRYAGDMGLVFDEDGYIVEHFTANIALRGILVTGSSVEVLETDGKSFHAEGLLSGPSNGQTFDYEIGENCKIYNVNDAAENFGEVTTLRVGDRIKVFSDMDGNLICIFVMNRMVDSPMYYNMSRCYMINGVTSRKPENGWYIFEMAAEGVVKEYRTQDVKLASKLDSFGYRCVGLRVNGDLIEKVYDPVCVAGYYSFGAFQYITTLMPPIIGTESEDKTASASGILAADCKIMNITGIGVEKGMEDTLRLGDQIIAYTNAKMEVTHAVIINRIIDGAKVAWNHTRKYDSKLEKTTREKVDGYYEFRVAIDGKDTVVKTSSEKLATKIDSMNPQMFALTLSGNIVKDVYPVVAATGGATRSNWFAVSSISADEIVTYSLKGSGTTKLKPSANLKVYNVSQVFDNHWGERTTLKVGDQIHAITDRKGEAVIIFVRSRDVDSPLYWNKTRKYNSNTQETTREPIDGYYVFELAVGGELKTFRTADKELASLIDSYKIAFTLKVEGDIIKQVYAGKHAKGIKQSGPSWLDVMSIDGTKIYVQQNIPTAKDVGEGYEATLDPNCKFYNVSSYAEPFGHATELKVGDRIHAFVNDDDKIVECYIVRANTRKDGAYGHCDHCSQEVFWMPWSGESFYQADGHYYLTHDLKLSKQLSIGNEEGQYDMVLDLNGHTVTASKRAFLVWEGTSFSIMDSVGGGSIVAKGIDGQGGTIMVYSGGKLNVYDGIYGRTDEQSEVATTNGGIFYCSGKESEVNIYGGTIQGGSAKHGGAIYVGNGKLNIHGGNIIGSEVERGGAIYNDKGVVTMTGGTIEGASCPTGGAVYQLSGSFSMSGGTVTGGTSAGVGGNFYLANSSTLNFTGGTVTNGKAVRGGNIGGYGTANISGGTVSKGEATYGGNICGLDNLRITISGNVKITDGTANNGGNIYLTKIDTTKTTKSQMTISGGTITGGLTPSGKGSNIETYREAKVTISGGNISGDVLLTNGTEVILSGEPVIGKGLTRGLAMESNVFAKLENLGEKASICISKVGAFTQTVENAEEYADNFYSYDPNLQIAASKNALHCGKFSLCSHCNDVVSWAPWTDESKAASGHYYLTGKTEIDTQYSIGNDDTTYDIILDLQGNILESDERAFLVWKGTSLTVMDSVGGGQIAAAGLNGNAGTMMIYEGGIFNLMSGTLTRTEQKNNTTNGGVIYMSGGASQFNMSGGTITGGVSATGGNLYISSGTFTMTGGTVSGGSCTNLGGNIYAAKNAKINISGGTITGTTGEFHQVAGSNVTISGGTVDCSYTIASAATTTLSGEPMITALKVDTGALLTLGELTGEADITVSANGIFTNANTDVANYIGFFTPAKQADSIEIRENALAYVKAVKDLNTVSNADLTLDADMKAVCPVCDEEVTWTGISADQAVTLDNGHYYLESDVTYTGAETPFLTAPSGNKTICLHLNGKNITATSHAAIDAASGTLNIMGSGTVTGSRSENLFGATITNKGATINLIGGTYTKAISATLSSVMTLRGGDVNMYAGAELLGVDDGGSASTVRAYNRTFNMYGGKISGGKTQIITSNWSATATGQFNMHGGEITGTVSINGASVQAGSGNIYGGTINGNLRVNNNTYVYISGGTISGVTIGVDALAATSGVTIAGNPVIANCTIPAGYKLTLEEMTQGASITVTASGAFTGVLTDAQSYVGYFHSEDAAASIEVVDNALHCVKEEITTQRCAMGHENHDAIQCDAPIVSWTKWEQTTSLPTAAGSYYLCAPVTVGPNNEITADITLDLNGFDITCDIPEGTTVTRRVFTVNEGGKLAITDLSGKETPGTVKINLDSSFSTLGKGCVVYCDAGDFTLYNGILDVNTWYTNSGSGTAIAVMSDQTFTMYGGVIKGVKGAKNTNGSTVSMYDDSNVAIHGGELIGGKGTLGGNVYVSTTGTLTITGGTFSAGTLNANGYGENIYVTKGNVSIGGDAQINGGICFDIPTSVTLSGKAVIKAADGSSAYDIRFFSDTSVLKGDGTPMLTANGKYTVVYDADGNIETLSLMS